MGFEPTNGGFADLSLGPLGYRAELTSIANLAAGLVQRRERSPHLKSALDRGGANSAAPGGYFFSIE